MREGFTKVDARLKFSKPKGSHTHTCLLWFSQVFTRGSWGTSDGTPGSSAEIIERLNYGHS